MKWLLLMLALAGCGATTNPVEACAAAGGTCRLRFCADGGAQIESVDCNPSHNPGGAVCCQN